MEHDGVVSRPQMEHFEIIQALCRCAIATKGEAVVHQVGRLRDALAASGDQAAADRLTRLLDPAAGVGGVRLRRS